MTRYLPGMTFLVEAVARANSFFVVDPGSWVRVLQLPNSLLCGSPVQYDIPYPCIASLSMTRMIFELFSEINGGGRSEKGDSYTELAYGVYRTCLECTELQADDRPTMSFVLSFLRDITRIQCLGFHVLKRPHSSCFPARFQLISGFGVGRRRSR